MKILLVGKYPPIEGGVSATTYWTARALALRGHEVHVVTNAALVEGNYKLHLFGDDVQRLSYSGAGLVKVHNVVGVFPGSHIPWSQPFTSLLAGAAIEVAREVDADLLLGWYFEPYGVAAAIAAQSLGLPLVLRHAGSDLSRLAGNQSLRQCYQWILRNAGAILTTPVSRDALRAIHPRQNNLVMLTASRLPSVFNSEASEGDIKKWAAEFPIWLDGVELPADLRSKLKTINNKTLNDKVVTIGIYGKVGDYKGSFELLDALNQICARGLKMNVLVIAIGNLPMMYKFYNRLLQYKYLLGHLWLVPPLAPWRIPEFIKSCGAVCYLENNFPVALHRPVIPREILAVGSCLICSQEIIEKSNLRENLVKSKNFVSIENVRNKEKLERGLEAVIAGEVDLKAIAAHGRFFSEFFEEHLSDNSICDALEVFGGDNFKIRQP